MKIRGLKSALVLVCGLLAVAANAAPNRIIKMPIRGAVNPAALDKANLTNHGGPTITSAKVVFIFWGPSFATGGADHTYATTLQAFRNQYGQTGEYNVITQYSGIQKANLGSGTADWFDTSTPPHEVTDSIVQSEVSAYLAGHGAFNNSTIYEVVIPSSSYSDDGAGDDSCGGPNLQYCAYHSDFSSGANDVKYAIEPWPGCSGCKVSGWTNVQNEEHFVCHETREAVTDADGNAWWDNSNGFEADDKCAWSPTPFRVTGTDGTGNVYGYQYEWSNSGSHCVQTR